MEMQRGVVGDLANHPASRAVQRSGLLPKLAALLESARRMGLPVIHCTASFRSDRAGSFRNMPAIERLLENPNHLLVGTESVDVVPELIHQTDIISSRHHGISPFTDTGLDTILRSLGIRTVIATGVSLNRGIIGMTIEAVNRGYQVLIPRDCVTGYPAAYGRAVLDNTLAAIATITESASLVAELG